MILKFRVLSPEEEDFFIDIEVEGSGTFIDLHNAIQNVVGYDKNEVSSFYLTDDSWQKGPEISLFDMTDDPESGVLTMDTAILEDYFFEEKQKLLYITDFFNERGFFMELFEIIEPLKDVKYPIVSNMAGTVPAQFLETQDLEQLIADELAELKELEGDDEEPDSDMFDNIDDYDEFM